MPRDDCVLKRHGAYLQSVIRQQTTSICHGVKINRRTGVWSQMSARTEICDEGSLQCSTHAVQDETIGAMVPDAALIPMSFDCLNTCRDLVILENPTGSKAPEKNFKVN